MTMISITFALLAYATVGSAQSASGSTASLFIPIADNTQSLVGSIAGSDATATTYVVNCPSSAASAMATAAAATGSSDLENGDLDSVDCGFDKPQTVVQGSSTLHYVFSDSVAAVAETLDCKLMGTTQAVCTGIAAGSGLTAAPTSIGFNIPPTTVATLTGSDLSAGYHAVLITAGAASGSSGSHSAMASTTGSAKAASGTGSAQGSTAASGTGSSTMTGSSTAASSTAKSNGGELTVEPALGMSIVAMLAVGLAAFVL